MTLVGTGGVGKTRLAIETARAAASRRPLGARLVELVEIRDTAGVADAVAAALGLNTEGEAAIDVLDRAGALDALLVLDNAEHVLDAAADVVTRAVGRGAGCVCSRRAASASASTASTSGRSPRSRPTPRAPRRGGSSSSGLRPSRQT